MLLAVMLSSGFGGIAVAAQGGNGAAKQDNSSTAKAKPANSASARSNAGGNAKSDHSQGNAGTSGNYNKPQPESNADQNQGGANGQCGPGSERGAYCSTRYGSASQNGKGDGQARGKPCAGCVGKADNKNPPGQAPDGSDHNNGYECDGNQGIGKTNPAHTGCTDAPPPPDCVPAEGNDCVPPVEECVPIDHPAGFCEPVVGGVDEERPPGGSGSTTGGANRPPTVAGVQLESAPQPTAGLLPQTGASSLFGPLGFGGLSMVLAGGAMLLLHRRRESAS